MAYDYQQFYNLIAVSGMAAYVADVPLTTTYRLVTGAPNYDPYRGSGPGRVYDDSVFHIYTAEKLLICSGEVLGKEKMPDQAFIGEYRLSGQYFDYDRVLNPAFQAVWRKIDGEDKHEFSQGFTKFLITGGLMPAGVVGSVWTSLSGLALGIPGRNFATTETRAPHCEYLRHYPPPS